MQKKVIALAIAGLFSGAAFAQSPISGVTPGAPSNVTLYGIADVGVVMDNSGYGTKTLVTSAAGSGSRIGVRGVEDLGNGLSAILVLEAGVQLDTGTVGGNAQAPGVNRVQTSSAFSGGIGNASSNVATGTNFFSRQAFAGLSSKTMGGLTFGRQYSAVVPVYAAIDVFGFATAGTMFTAFAYIPGYTTRQNNVASYRSPTFFDGLQVEVVAGSGTENNVQGNDLTAGVSDKGGRLSGLNAIYNKGPLNIGIAYQDLNANTAITAVQTQVISNSMWVGGGSYNFGMAKLYAGYASGKERNRNGVATAGPAPLLIPTNSNAWHIGVNVPAFKGNVLVGYAKLRDKTPNVTNADFQAWGINYRYPLSKRTTLYAGYAKGDNDSNGTRILLGGGDTSALVNTLPANNKIGYDPSRWDFGMTHSF